MSASTTIRNGCSTLAVVNVICETSSHRGSMRKASRVMRASTPISAKLPQATSLARRHRKTAAPPRNNGACKNTVQANNCSLPKLSWRNCNALSAPRNNSNPPKHAINSPIRNAETALTDSVVRRNQNSRAATPSRDKILCSSGVIVPVNCRFPRDRTSSKRSCLYCSQFYEIEKSLLIRLFPLTKFKLDKSLI